MTMMRHEDMIAATDPENGFHLILPERRPAGRYLIWAALRIGVLAVVAFLLVAHSV